LPPKSLSNSGQRGLTGRLRSKADQEQIKSKSGSLRIVVSVGSGYKSCVDTYAYLGRHRHRLQHPQEERGKLIGFARVWNTIRIGR
ncbi:hypothetical protein, partial [Pseudomonas paralactis]|uniref:hypothetical protein n=1 Tax=Pseudomonas paralactis TaxID=1615673 RepID=UPI001EE2F870